MGAVMALTSAGTQPAAGRGSGGVGLAVVVRADVQGRPYPRHPMPAPTDVVTPFPSDGFAHALRAVAHAGATQDVIMLNFGLCICWPHSVMWAPQRLPLNASPAASR